MTDTQLQNLIVKMRIPIHRKEHFNKTNLEWLQKNLSKFNSEHKNFDKAMSEINRRLEEKEYEN